MKYRIILKETFILISSKKVLTHGLITISAYQILYVNCTNFNKLQDLCLFQEKKTNFISLMFLTRFKRLSLNSQRRIKLKHARFYLINYFSFSFTFVHSGRRIARLNESKVNLCCAHQRMKNDVAAARRGELVLLPHFQRTKVIFFVRLCKGANKEGRRADVN